jgi:uncharacterized repeat protein (TIGR01451 family)
VAKRLDRLGANVLSRVGNSIFAEVSIDHFEEIAGYKEVVAIRPPDRMFTHSGPTADPALNASVNPSIRSLLRPDFDIRAESVRSRLRTSLAGLPSAQPMMAANVSEGDITHRAMEARNFFGVTGAGVKIGVLSDGVNSLAALQASGDLPPGVTVLSGQAGSGNEGCAMLEIVHDLAPNAQLFFATADPTPVQFAQNIRDLAAAGCDIIVDDIIYLSESPFQDGQAMSVASPSNGGIIAQAVRDVTASGVLYFSSAGNEGNLDDGTAGTWEGDFSANGTPPVLAGAGVAHNFGDGGQSNLVTANGVAVLLDWSDPLGASGNDYDVYDLDGTLTTIFDASTDVQDGDDDPIEISGQAFAGERLVVMQFSGADRYIRLENFRGRMQLATPGASFGHSSVANAFAVAAVDVATAMGGTVPFVGGATNPVETFSADGPRHLFYNPDSTPITPGDVSSTGGTVRQKPDIAAADGVMCAAPGFNPFFGTSAAAPHPAAIAGLLLSANPALTPAQVRTALTSSALDIEAAGVDRDSGSGIVKAFQALQAIGATAQAFLDRGAITIADSGNGNSLVEPCESVSLTIPLTNIGGATATAINGTLTSGSAGVTILMGSSAYPDLMPSAGANNGTPFVFKYDCAAACGAVLDFTLTVTYSGGPSPQTFDFTIATGSAGTPVTTSYTGPPVPIPDSPGANVPGPIALASLPVSGITGNIFDLDLRIDGTSCSAIAGSTTVGIDHTFVNDLEVSLISPSGTEIRLINRTDGAGNNFCQTLLDDESAGGGIQGVSSANAPFTGSFTPENPLSGFDGEDPNGTWMLKVQDFFIGDTGNIRAFSLIITPAQCAQYADLSITKTTPTQQAVVGSNVTYTLVVANNGNATANNVTVTDNLPSQLMFVSCSAPPDGTCGGAGNNRTITYAALAPGATRTITIVAKVVSTGSIANSASVASTTPEADTSDNSSTTPAIVVVDICVQDDGASSKVALADSTTGFYQICCGGGGFYTGTGKVTKSGNVVAIEDNTSSRRVLIKVDKATKRGSVAVQSPPGRLVCSITDRNITNNTCTCSAP